MPLTIFEIADFFLSKQSMTHKKLQKLCYYAQCWYLANYNTPLIMNRFEAWIHGPVCPDLYFKYKDYGWAHIQKLTNYTCVLDTEIQNFLNTVWKTYGSYADFELENMSKSQFPWQNARKGLSDTCYQRPPISWTDMQSTYQKLLQTTKNKRINKISNKRDKQ